MEKKDIVKRIAVLSGMDEMSADELKELQKSLSIDPNKVLILEHQRMPKSGGVTMLMLIGGVLLILAGPALFFLTRSKG